MIKVMRKAYSEVDEILKYLPKEYVEKIPQKFRRMFFDCKLENYEVKIDPNKSINEQKLMYETLVILTILKYNFWCETAEEKKQLEMKLIENDLKAKEMYDISKIMNRSSINVHETRDVKSIDVSNLSNTEFNRNLPIKVEKQTWFSKIIMKIKNIFKK